MAIALLKFTQGATVGADGQALFGVVGTPVVLTNASNAGVKSWQIDLVFVDASSGIARATPYAFNNDSTTPTATFTPDVTGGYRWVLSVWTVKNRVGGPSSIDMRVFGVREANGRFVPPAQIWPIPLLDPRSGDPSAKPNEMNFGGNPDGWSPYLEEWFAFIDSIPLVGMTIASFAAVTPVVETGITVVNPAFTASFVGGPPLTLVLTNGTDGEAKDVHATPTSFASAHSFPTTTPGQVLAFHINGSKPPGPDPAQANANIIAGQRVFAGVVVAGSSPATLIAAATFNQLGLAKPGLITGFVGTGGTSRGQILWPVRYGNTPVFKDAATGFGVPYTVLGTFTYTNAQTFAESYYQFETASSFTGAEGFTVA